MNENTNPLLLAIGHQLRIANLLKLHEMKDHPGADKRVLRRIGTEMDQLPKLQNTLREDEAAAASLPADDSGPDLSGVSPNTARRAMGLLPADSGAAPTLDPGIYGRNLRAFTLELLHAEVRQLRRVDGRPAAVAAYTAVEEILDRYTRDNIADGHTRAPSYRDPDLSDKWLAEAVNRANYDTSRKFTDHDSRAIIRRLTAEVRKLNKMLGR